jgi:histidinol-phosphate phosphatase family protein
VTRTVFLDRDGTLNREIDFVRTPAELELLPGTATALRRLRDAGLRLVVVTNQSGIARGYYDESTLAAIHGKLVNELPGLFAAILHCPHLPEASGPYGHECACRKPAPGLLHEARELLGCQLDGDYVVGDSARDLLMSRELPMKRVLLRCGKPVQAQLETLANAGMRPDTVLDDLQAATDWILQDLSQQNAAARS